MRAWNIARPGQEPHRHDLQSFDGEENPWLYAARVLALHIYPESRHFTVGVDWSDYRAMETGVFHIRCVAVKDCLLEREATYEIPIELVGAAAVAFHSEHEGHPLEMSWNGEQFHPAKG